ncbi:2Fe-2S iron-sulfur cluster binding domain-containing protein [Azospirillum brasilense]|uniref:adenylate/guanylate cyclase domain-containing protein n=1 Tax=Azospirillum argentinense TaxID=2970906 RepID=UPI00190EB9C4|nr:adenylate/guanylate cyclase domain-containing protein [Azospirillum argentinense]MBK3801715.1 2Fe-2S iron-sulfur cluster binding domain-containing protein [Azospirillum argentinense]
MKRRIERPLRLFTGLTLFTFVITHFLAHAAGLLLLPGMEVARRTLLWVWDPPPGQALLAGSFVTPAGLGLWALYRRRHLRMPAGEAWQLGLGLCIPLLLISHGMAGMLSDDLYNDPLTYPRAIVLYWITAPETLLWRQLLLLVIVWVHGCIGVRGWLMTKPWYRRRASLLGAFAMLLPVLALAGIVNAGWDAERRAAADPAYLEQFRPPPAGTPEAENRAALAAISGGVFNTYVLLLVGTLGMRQYRNWRARATSPVRIAYPGGRTVTVPRGTSVLEASRANGIPHTALCGGRGRCSTCRIRVTEGVDALPPPNATERAVLERMKAPRAVRLACQLRPVAPLSVTPLLSARDNGRTFAVTAPMDSGRELAITALFVDLRGSTSLAAERLPFDALFIVTRYVQVVTDAIRKHGGYVIAIAGDGVMGMFANEDDPTAAAASALRATADLWRDIEVLSRDLAEELDQPLAFGAGVHSGLAVVGAVACSEDGSLQFIGDTGNVAARLEEMTKTLGATGVFSDAAAELAGLRQLEHLERREVAIRGRDGTLGVRTVRRQEDLRALLESAGA